MTYIPPSEAWGVRKGREGWEAYKTPRGTMRRPDAIEQANRKNKAKAASRFGKVW